MQLRIAACSFLAFALSLSPAARCQKTITCSSDDGKRHYCSVHAGGGAQMTNQRSSAACQQGYSWGYDRRGVWVDHGCRADFTVYTSNGPGGGYGGGRPVSCSSDDGGRHYCDANTGGGVQMTNQRSGSACQQGYSWGYDSRGIWVDHGCRADFMTYAGGGPGYGGPGVTVSCSSDNGGRQVCTVDTRGGVQMANQRSGSPCRQNYSWGYDNRGIWVDHGCRADFTVNAGGGGFNNGGQTITCSSDDGGRHTCAANIVRGARLVNQRSGSPCRQNYSWGYDNRGIWVDHGCRADFAAY